MGKFAFTLIALFQIATAQSQASVLLPSIEDVIKNFYSNYAIDNSTDGYITFEKRKDCWFAVSNKFERNALVPIRKYLFYQQHKGLYEKLPFLSNNFKKEVNVSDYIDDYTIREYNLQPYYGYPGWYKDVIRYLTTQNDISENELNALGRAYSDHARNLLLDQTQDALPNELWKIPFNINCLSPTQIEEFNRLEIKSQEYFKKLDEKNPDFETPVGKIGIKHANEVMVQFHILLAHANDFALKMNLPDNLYSEAELEIPMKNLNQCKQNSVLVSFGDNDFYPILYLQHKKGFRKDVYLINYNLIGLDRYIYRITQSQFNAEAIKIASDTTLYRGKQNEVIYVEDSTNTIKMSDLIDILKKNKAIMERPSIKMGSIILDGLDNSKILISLKEIKYLLKHQWILLNILDNLRQRKIYFQNDFNDELKGLNNYLKKEEGLFFLDN